MIGTVSHCSHVELAARLTAAGQWVDLLATDCPYSAEVHAGHGTMERHGTSTPPAYDGADRREIDYAHWTPADVDVFVEAWEPLTRGWFCAMADDELALAWKAALRNAGRLVFPLIPCTERGATVRLAGEGPSSCTTFLIVARPRTAEGMSAALSLAYESHYVGPRGLSVCDLLTRRGRTPLALASCAGSRFRETNHEFVQRYKCEG